jgi:hypothetical protein
MKTVLFFLLFFVSLIACTDNPARRFTQDNKGKAIPDTAEMTNNFYDNTETFPLPVNEISVDGEVENPGKVELSSLPLRSVIVKEALPDGKGGDSFVGAYRYDGYSLFDILENSIPSKANKAEFSPIIDLYVEIENISGEKVVFSWAEIYYPVNLHRILIASSVSRIVPSKTKDLWPLPSSSKLVAANDLLTCRNISDPVRIKVLSLKRSYPVVQGMSPMYSPSIELFNDDSLLAVIAPQAETGVVTYGTVFYGRGRGIHSTTPFTGVPVKDVLSGHYPVTEKRLKEGVFAMAGKDGYRCAVSYSELFNRNDQQEMLLIRCNEGEDGGLYRIFPAADFFSDRAIKSLSRIDFLPLH